MASFIAAHLDTMMILGSLGYLTYVLVQPEKPVGKKTSSFPRLVATESDVTRLMGMSDTEAPQDSPGFVYLCVQFRNDPALPTTDSIAHQLTCNIMYIDAGTSECVLEGSGRWMDSIPPSPTSDTPELIDFAIGQSRQLCVAVKPLDKADCYAIPAGKWSERERLWHFIPATEINASIRLRCPYFDQTWLLRFRNTGVGSALKILEFRQKEI